MRREESCWLICYKHFRMWLLYSKLSFSKVGLLTFVNRAPKIRIFSAFFCVIWWCISIVWFGLIWFYGISTILGYLMRNPVCTFILNI